MTRLLGLALMMNISRTFLGLSNYLAFIWNADVGSRASDMQCNMLVHMIENICFNCFRVKTEQKLFIEVLLRWATFYPINFDLWKCKAKREPGLWWNEDGEIKIKKANSVLGE